jgi:methylthioxylose transferase
VSASRTEPRHRDPVARGAGHPRVERCTAPWRHGVVAVTVMVVSLLGCYLVGRLIQARGIRLFTALPPLTGGLDPEVTWRVLVPAGIGATLVLTGPVIARRVGWRTLCWAAAAAALGWGLALAFVEGLDGLVGPVGRPTDYLATLPSVSSPGGFLRGFVDGIGPLPTHARAHPPGLVVGLWWLDRIGLGGAGWFATIQLVAGAAAVPAAMLAVREVASERVARAAAPFVVLLPAAVAWQSGDAIFLGVGAWSVALLVLATGGNRRRGDLLASAGGMLGGLGLFLSYGLAPLAAVPVAVAIARRAARPLIVGLVGAGVVAAAFLVAGFWWWDGLTATRLEYASSAALSRPYAYYLFANLAAFSVALGPAVIAAVIRLRDRRLWLLVGGGLVAALLADVSGLSKGEVERIWLPFVPWIAVAAAALPRREVCGWLLVQAGWGIGVQVLVRSPW